MDEFPAVASTEARAAAVEVHTQALWALRKAQQAAQDTVDRTERRAAKAAEREAMATYKAADKSLHEINRQWIAELAEFGIK